MEPNFSNLHLFWARNPIQHCYINCTFGLLVVDRVGHEPSVISKLGQTTCNIEEYGSNFSLSHSSINANWMEIQVSHRNCVHSISIRLLCTRAYSCSFIPVVIVKLGKLNSEVFWSWSDDCNRRNQVECRIVCNGSSDKFTSENKLIPFSNFYFFNF